MSYLVDIDDTLRGATSRSNRAQPAPPSRASPPLSAVPPIHLSPPLRPSQHKHDPFLSLEERCRILIVTHFERYPVEVFGYCGEDDWESIVELRHRKTAPQNGKGGLDGTGRLTPAIRAEVMSKIEAKNPHLAESTKTDVLVWKDCVNQRFKLGGFTRPVALSYPWPVLVETIQSAGTNLVNFAMSPALSRENKEKETKQPSLAIDLEKTIQTLVESPMNVSLLQATGIGKTVKQFIKACKQRIENTQTWNAVRRERFVKRRQISPMTQMEELLAQWKNLAKASGVVIKGHQEASNNTDNAQEKVQEDLRLAEQCKSWRELYQVLQEREARTRASQGARMREIRQNLNKGRPKVVKVVPTKQKYSRILDKQHKQAATSMSSSSWSTGGEAGKHKMSQLRKETAALSALRHNKGPSSSNTAKKRPAEPFAQRTTRVGSFGAAVAFAQGPSSAAPAAKKTKVQVISLGGNKHMKLPKNKAAARDGLLASMKKTSKRNRK